MNMFKAFESRVAEAFEGSHQGFSAPFSFKKLARRAAHEMEQETFDIDGTPTAPALTTVLVAVDDDALMRPFYGQLTNEIALFVEAEAARKGYVFVGKPLARFIADDSLKPGRFAVFANNVDAATLEQLRAEETDYLVSIGAIPAPAPTAAPEPVVAQALTSEAPVPAAETDDSAIGLSVFADEPDELPLEPPAAPNPAAAPNPVVADHRSLADALPEVVDMQANPIVTPVPEVMGAPVTAVPETSAAPAEFAVPGTMHHEPPNTQDSSADAEPVPVVEVDPVTCLLIDRQSGRTYIGTAPKTIIGRERTPKGIVLHDPNVSRTHAELTFDGTVWRIHDLGSTNGTLVNDVDVDRCVLRDGDLITLGLLNLEFRES